MTPQQKVDYIMRHFNWNRTLTMMRAVKWTHGEKPVTLEKIKICASGLFADLLKDRKCRGIYSGGFQVSRYFDEFGFEQYDLEFVGERCHSEGMDELTAKEPQ